MVYLDLSECVSEPPAVISASTLLIKCSLELILDHIAQESFISFASLLSLILIDLLVFKSKLV